MRVSLPYDTVGLRTFLALNDLEGYLVALFEEFIAFFLDGAEMHEDVSAAVVAQKAIAFDIVEPLHCPFVLSHEIYPYAEMEFYTAICAMKAHMVTTTAAM